MIRSLWICCILRDTRVHCECAIQHGADRNGLDQNGTRASVSSAERDIERNVFTMERQNAMTSTNTVEQFRTDITALATKYAENDCAVLARAIIESISESDKFRALFSRTVNADDSVTLYFAGMSTTIRKVSGKWIADSNQSVTYDRNGLRRVHAELKQTVPYESLKDAEESFTKRARNNAYKIINERERVYTSTTRVSAAEAKQLQDAAAAALAERDAIATQAAADRAELETLRAQLKQNAKRSS